MQSFKYNKENNLISNQIYDILVELQNQIKLIILCKVPEHKGIKGNEEADKTAKQAIDMPGITTTNYYLTNKRARNSKWQRE